MIAIPFAHTNVVNFIDMQTSLTNYMCTLSTVIFIDWDTYRQFYPYIRFKEVQYLKPIDNIFQFDSKLIKDTNKLGPLPALAWVAL